MPNDTDESNGGAGSNLLNSILATETAGVPILSQAKRQRSKRKAASVEPNEVKETINDSLDQPSTSAGVVEASVDNTDEKNEIHKKTRRHHIKVQNRDMIGRHKPGTDDDIVMEKELLKIATKGVVQLFNTVKEHRALVSERLGQAGSTDLAREKAYQSIQKGDFLDKLRGRKMTIDAEPVQKKRWKALSEDFLATIGDDKPM